MNALLLSETVYCIMDPGGLAEAERVAEMLIEDLPAFARSPLRLQWSPDHITQRCATPPISPKALFAVRSKPRCFVRWSHGQCRRLSSLISVILENQNLPVAATIQGYLRWQVYPLKVQVPGGGEC